MISIFIATSGRPAMFRSMLESLYATTQGYDVEVVAAIDDDYAAWDVAHELGCGIWYNQKRRGALQAWNDAFSMTKGNFLVPAGDDQIFHPDWLKYALESFRDNLDNWGVLGMNDLAYNGNTQVATMWMFNREWCKSMMGGVFAPPCYHYYCVDLEWNEKAKMYNEFFWDSRAIVEHLHSAHGKRPIDTTDSYKEDKWMEVDNRTFEQRKEKRFPIEWEAII